MHAHFADARPQMWQPFTRLLSARPNVFVLAGVTLAVAILSSIYSTYRYHLIWPEHTLYNLANGFGPVLLTMHETGHYAMCKQYVADEAFWDYFFGKDLSCLTTHRLPFITYFLLLISQISLNLYFVAIVKNIIFYGISLYSLLRISREYKLTLLPVALCFVALFLLRSNAAIASSLPEEEGYVYHLLPLLFILLFLVRRQTRSDLVIIALVTGVLFLTKSALFIVCALAALVTLVRRPESEATGWIRGLPLVFVTAAMLGWGLFTLSETGRFAVGPGMSSINGLNFYKGNNPNTEAYYPLLHVDRMDDDSVTKPEISAKNEWQLDDYYKKKALEFIRDNPQAAIRILLVRLRIAFLSVEQVGIVPEHGQEPGVLLSMIPTRIIFLFAIFAAVTTVVRGNDASSRWAAYGFLGLIAAYSAPYLAGFVWYRHMMPVYATAPFYLLALYGRASLASLRVPARTPVGAGRTV